jgi:hypothetical protein
VLHSRFAADLSAVAWPLPDQPAFSRRTPLNFFFTGAFFWSMHLPVFFALCSGAFAHYIRAS